MATTYYSWFFPVQTPDLPKEPTCLDDVGHLIETGFSKEKTLWSASRRNWIVGTLEHICLVYGTQHLLFIRRIIAILDPQEIHAVIDDIYLLFNSFSADPIAVEKILNQGWSEADILEAIQGAQPSLHPDGRGEGDDVTI
jgi:hypothetical protein